MEKIKIKCPNCGAVLTVLDDPANKGKSVKCPVCQMKHPFESFRRVVPVKDLVDDGTSSIESINQVRTESVSLKSAHSPGFLVDELTGARYELGEGLNLIGRMSGITKELGAVGIVTDDMGFSRKHLFIEADKLPDGSFKHIAFDASNKNATFINGHELEIGAKMIIHDGDVISSSCTSLSFHADNI